MGKLFAQRACVQFSVNRASLSAVLAIAWLVSAAPVRSAECSLNVMKAYETAKARGWKFQCPASPDLVAKGFVTYPPSNIGCTFKTGISIPLPVPMFGSGQGALMLFGGQVGAPALKNGWQFVRYEISGGQFQLLPPATAIVSAGVKLDKPSNTYNFKLTALVLKKSGGQCSKAVDEAF